METRNVTLSLPKDLLRKLKVLSAEKDTSISGLLTGLLKDLVSREDAYSEAWRRTSNRMRAGFDLGTKGSITWTRDDLHER
ncbi:MAG: CopG family transcriptional regulator [Actinomycetota bacterium]